MPTGGAWSRLFPSSYIRPQKARKQDRERFFLASPCLDRCTTTAGATPLQYYHIINIFGVSEQAMSDVKSLFRKKTKQAVRMYPVLGGRGVPGRGVYSERARPAHPRLSPCIWPMRFSRPLSSPLPPSHPPYVYRSRPRLSPLSCKYISFSPLAPLSRLSFSNFVCSPLLPLFPPIHIDLFHLREYLLFFLTGRSKRRKTMSGG